MPELTLEQALSLAADRLQAGDLQRAHSVCEQVLAAFPEHPYALSMLGIIEQQNHRHTEAIDLMRRAIKQAPADPDLHYNLGKALQEIAKYKEAAAAYREALTLDPNLADAHINLGNMFRDLDETDLAIDCYEQALAVAPDHPQAKQLLADTRAGRNV